MRLLVTGFGPFPGVPINPTELIVRRLGRHPSLPPWAETLFEVLPVEYETGGDAAVRLLQERHPDVVLMLGVKSAGSGISLERFALNVDDCSVPDAVGVVREGLAIREGGPNALRTRFDLVALRDAMAARRYPVGISNHAGTYLCNHVYYKMLDVVGASMPTTRVLFVHVPVPSASPAGEKHEAGSLGYLEECVRQLVSLLLG